MAFFSLVYSSGDFALRRGPQMRLPHFSTPAPSGGLPVGGTLEADEHLLEVAVHGQLERRTRYRVIVDVEDATGAEAYLLLISSGLAGIVLAIGVADVRRRRRNFRPWVAV